MYTDDYTAHAYLPFGAAGRIAHDMLPFCTVSRKMLLETVIEAKQDLRFLATKYAFILEQLEHAFLSDDEFASSFRNEFLASVEEYYKNDFGEFADEILKDMGLERGQRY